jgi:membrane associated rhomboid family serine protease
MVIYKITTLAAFAVAAIWAFNKPDYDSIGAAVAAFATLAALFFVDEKRKSSGQSMEVGAGGIGIQAGRDATNNKIRKK